MRTKGLAKHMMKHGNWKLTCASEPEGLAVGRCTQALHGNLAGLGGGHQGGGQQGKIAMQNTREMVNEATREVVIRVAVVDMPQRFQQKNWNRVEV